MPGGGLCAYDVLRFVAEAAAAALVRYDAQLVMFNHMFSHRCSTTHKKPRQFRQPIAYRPYRPYKRDMSGIPERDTLPAAILARLLLDRCEDMRTR